MPTAQSLVSQAQILLLDPEETVWSSTVLLGYLNEGQRDFALRIRGHVQEATQAVSASVSLYTLPSDCIGIDWVDTANFGGSQLQEVSTKELDWASPNWMASTASAASYYVRDRQTQKQIRLYPIPTSTDTLSYRFFGRPADLALASTSALPQWTHPFLLFYVVARAAGDEGDLQDEVKAGHFKERYESGVSLVKEILDAR